MPTGLTASAVADSATSVKLSWDDPRDDPEGPDPGIQRYRIQHSEIQGSLSGANNDVSAGNTSYTVTGLTEGSFYNFRVEPVYSDSPLRTAHADIKAKPGAPNAPQNPSAEITGPGEVTLTWDDPDNAAITHYELEANNSGNWAEISLAEITAITATTPSGSNKLEYVIGSLGGTNYSFKWRAVSDYSSGDPSGPVGVSFP